MKAPLFDKVLKLSQIIAQASADNNDQLRTDTVQKLQELCQAHQGSAKDHPLQWEMLADFTNDGDLALDIYQIALDKAIKLELVNANASIHLAMAQRYQEFGEHAKALAAALQASELTDVLTNDDLKSEVNNFLSALVQ